MVFNYTYRIGLEDCGRENKATNKAILTILENIAGLHSATVGLGLNEISETGCAWVVLNWQMQIIKRPEYNDELTVYTWSTSADKLFAERWQNYRYCYFTLDIYGYEQKETGKNYSRNHE